MNLRQKMIAALVVGVGFSGLHLVQVQACDGKECAHSKKSEKDCDCDCEKGQCPHRHGKKAKNQPESAQKPSGT